MIMSFKIVKINEESKCYCTLCKKIINYGSSGKKALAAHCERASHLDHVKVKISNMTIQAVATGTTSGEKSTSQPGPSTSATAVKLIAVAPSGKPVTLHQRVYNQEVC
jgi:hypothetical protein